MKNIIFILLCCSNLLIYSQVFSIYNDKYECTQSETCIDFTNYDRPFITYCFCLPSKMIYSSKFIDTTTLIIDIIFTINFSDTVDYIIFEDIKKYSNITSLLPLKEISNDTLKKEVLTFFKYGSFSYKLNGVERKPLNNLKEIIKMKLVFIPKEEP
jgi:hypothetical protein